MYESLASALQTKARGDFLPPHVLGCIHARIGYLEEIAADERFMRDLKITDVAIHENDQIFLRDLGVRW